MRSYRVAPFAGIAFVVFFLASVMVSSVPANTAPDSAWIADYDTHGEQARHLATGILLVLAALSLLAFLTHLWSRISAAVAPRTTNPLPLLTGGVAAACIASGGVLMAAASGASLLFSQPLPGAELLRFANDAGFAMVGLAGMLATSLSIAMLAIHATAAGIFGRRWRAFSLVVAIILLGSIAFIPVVALLIWLPVTAISLIRRTGAATTPIAAGPGTLQLG